MKQPTTVLRIDGSYFAFDERGEVIEATTTIDRVPYWDDASICGSGGHILLRIALEAAEACARATGYDVERVPAP